MTLGRPSDVRALEAVGKGHGPERLAETDGGYAVVPIQEEGKAS